MSKANPLISVVVPAFNEAPNLRELTRRLSEVLAPHGEFEIVVVNDGSRDETLEVLRALSVENPQIRYLSFSRNFGHQAAIRAGLDYSRGDCVISMDADLQHPPEFIETMIREWKAGAGIVLTRQRDRGRAGFIKRQTAALFYKTINFLGDMRVEPGAQDFRLMDRAAVNALAQFREPDLFIRGVVPLLGFKAVVLDYDVADRLYGETKYSLVKMMSLAMNGILSTSLKPLRIASVLSMAVIVPTVLYSLYAIYMYLAAGRTQPGWASTVVVVSLLGGLQLFVLGIIGEYIAQTIRQTRLRPSYIIEETSPQHETDGNQVAKKIV